MSMLSDLLNKAPQSIKDKYKIKIRDKAIEKVHPDLQYDYNQQLSSVTTAAYR